MSDGPYYIMYRFRLTNPLESYAPLQYTMEDKLTNFNRSHPALTAGTDDDRPIMCTSLRSVKFMDSQSFEHLQDPAQVPRLVAGDMAT